MRLLSQPYAEHDGVEADFAEISRHYGAHLENMLSLARGPGEQYSEDIWEELEGDYQKVLGRYLREEEAGEYGFPASFVQEHGYDLANKVIKAADADALTRFGELGQWSWNAAIPSLMEGWAKKPLPGPTGTVEMDTEDYREALFAYTMKRVASNRQTREFLDEDDFDKKPIILSEEDRFGEELPEKLQLLK